MTAAPLRRAGLVASGLLVAAAPAMAGSSADESAKFCDVDRPAVAHYAGQKPYTGPLTRTAPHPCVYPTGIPGYETTLGITRHGAVFYQGYESRTAALHPAPDVARSTDGGVTWKVVSPSVPGADKEVHPASADPYLTVDERTGRVFTTDYAGAGSLVSFSDDLGATWTNSFGGVGNADHQTVFTGPPPANAITPTVGYPDVVYYCAISGGASLFGTASACSASLDGGLTFHPTGEPAFTDDTSQQEGDFGIPGECGGSNGQGVVGPDGTVYLPRGWCGHPWLAMSKDEGLTWTRVQVSGEETAMAELAIEEAETGVAVGPHGQLYYVFLGRDRMPHFSYSLDGGTHWSKSVNIAAPGVREAELPDIAVSRTGTVGFVYIGSLDSKGAPFAACYDLVACAQSGDPSSSADEADVSWNAYITITREPDAANPVFFSASLNPPDDPVGRGYCGPRPGRCNFGDFQDIQFNPVTGEPWVSMVDACRGVYPDDLQAVDCVHPKSAADKVNNAEEGIVGRLTFS